MARSKGLFLSRSIIIASSTGCFCVECCAATSFATYISFKFGTKDEVSRLHTSGLNLPDENIVEKTEERRQCIFF